MRVILRVSDVELKNEGAYTLIIKGTYPSGHRSYDFEIEYLGASVIIREGDLLDGQEDLIKDELDSLISYGPFDLNVVEEVLIGKEVIFYRKSIW